MEFKEIRIIGVDKDNIGKDQAIAHSFKYPLMLSGNPDDLWIKFLHHAYRMSSFSKKRQYTVVANLITLTIFGDDNIQVQLDCFKELVLVANNEYVKMLQRIEDEKKAEEERKRKELETIQRLRSESDRLKL